MTDSWIIVPAHNEAANIAEVVTLCHSHGRILVVDDGSTDETGKQAALAGARVLVNPRGSQHGHGIRAGLRYCLNRFPQSIVTIDAGLSFTPLQIPLLLAVLSECDVAIGSRVVADAWRQQPWRRKALTTAATRFLGLLTGGEPLDYSSFRAYNMKAAEQALMLSRDLDMRCHAFNPQLVYRLWQAGLRLRQVPIHYRATNSTLDLASAWGALWGLLCLWHADRWRKES